MTSSPKITTDGNVLEVSFPYSKSLLADLKSKIPYQSRTWNHERKTWVIDPQYLSTLESIFRRKWPMFQAPQLLIRNGGAIAKQVIKVMYIGATKVREDGTESAFGEVNGEWSYIFPRDVLQAFFTGFTPSAPEKTTLYSLLQVQPTVDEQALSDGFRRMAKLWHPDINHEPNAHDMFIRIKQAYDTLKDPNQRKKYDVGLRLETEMNIGAKKSFVPNAALSGFRAPMTCGMLLVDVEVSVRNTVKAIHKWEDIVNEHGQTMVTSWSKGDDKYQINWT